MKFTYNDAEYVVEQTGYNIRRIKPDGSSALVGGNLFAGMPAAEAEAKAQNLVKSINPVGVKTIGPDVSHPNKVGDLKIVGPDIAHPNFIHWDKDSTSFPKSS